MVSGDPEFTMNGTLNMHSESLQVSEWAGEPIDIGNDSTSGRAKLNISGAGTGIARVSAQVDFNANADVNIGAGGHLQLTNTVNFNTVNGSALASFGGAGEISFSGPVNVNEAATLNLLGGVVDLDGSDTVGDVVNVNAPLVINAATLKSFGRVNLGGGVNVLNIDAKNHAGSLMVNLDDAGQSWTLNQLGQMNLVASTGAPTTLIQGADVNLHGAVKATGAVGIRSSTNIGGTINLLSAG